MANEALKFDSDVGHFYQPSVEAIPHPIPVNTTCTLAIVDQLASRHDEETNRLLELFKEEERALRQLQGERQASCPVCDYRRISHEERTLLYAVSHALRKAHTCCIADEKEQLAASGQLPAPHNFWDYLDHDAPKFKHGLLRHAHSLEYARACGVGSAELVRQLSEQHAHEWELLESSLSAEQ